MKTILDEWNLVKPPRKTLEPHQVLRLFSVDHVIRNLQPVCLNLGLSTIDPCPKSVSSHSLS